jgi:hypothetical protein
MVLPLGRILGVTGQSYLGLSKILDDLDLWIENGAKILGFA